MTLSHSPRCAILLKDNLRRDDVEQLAAKLRLPVIESRDCEATPVQKLGHCEATPVLSRGNLIGNEGSGIDFALAYDAEHLALHDCQSPKQPPFYIDFLDKRFFYRLRAASLKKEMLARAIGCHPDSKPRIVDGTAGVGRDAFLLARLGFEVTMIEQSPILAALLADALVRASKHPITAPICARLTLLQGDSRELLPDLQPTVVYLDPMFPAREKSAAVKKEMAIVQQLVGVAQPTANLLQLALSCANKRVVIKRPRLAAPLDERPADFALIGNTSRFDVYLTQKSN